MLCCRGTAFPNTRPLIGLTTVPIRESQQLIYGVVSHKGRLRESWRYFLHLAEEKLLRDLTSTRLDLRTPRLPLDLGCQLLNCSLPRGQQNNTISSDRQHTDCRSLFLCCKASGSNERLPEGGLFVCQAKSFSGRKCGCAIAEALCHNQWNSFWLWLAKRFMYFTFPEFALIIGDMETKLRILYSDRKQSWRNEQC